MSVTDLNEARASAGVGPEDPWPPEEPSIADRAENGEGGDDGEELFPLGSLEGDPKMTLKGIVRSGRPVEVTASLRAAEVPIRNGQLLDPEKSGEVLISFLPEKVEVVIKREGDDVRSYKIRQVLRPSYVQEAGGLYTRSQVEDILTHLGLPASSDKVRELLG